MNFINQCTAQHVDKCTAYVNVTDDVNVITTSKTVISISQQIHKHGPCKSWFYVRWNELRMQVDKKIYSLAVYVLRVYILSSVGCGPNFSEGVIFCSKISSGGP